MKMVYLFNHFEVLEKGHIGIRKKMYMQMEAFKELGYDPIYIVADEEKILVKDIVNNCNEIFYFAEVESLYRFLRQMIHDIKPGFVYMRYRMIYTPGLYGLYRDLCRENDKVICEFYTYPYDTEFPDDRLDMLIDRIYAPRLHEFMECSTNYNACDEIMNIPSVGISNGFDVLGVPLAGLPADGHADFNMVAVATMQPWHGYERIIEGIREYYRAGGERVLRLHLIGEGRETQKYKELAREYGIEENILFHGMVTDKKVLDGLYDGMDIAIGSVGMHRLSLKRVSPIKASEYCSRGIPFVIGYEDISFEDGCPFCYKVPMDDSPIDMNGLMDFAGGSRTLGMAERMRQYAVDKLSWSSQMKKVLQKYFLL